MTDHENLHQDFFEVHHAQLTALATRAEELALADPEHLTVEQYDSASEPVITVGALTAESLRAALEEGGHSLGDAEADEIASDQNRTQVAISKAKFAGVQTRASLVWLARQTDQGPIDTYTNATLAYAWAERSMTQPNEGLTVDVVRLHGVEQLGEVAEYKLSAEDSLIQDTLHIMTTGDEIANVHSSVEPLEDEEFGHWAEVLGPTIANVQMALVGVFQDEADLDQLLGAVRQQFAGTPQEENLPSVLEGIRARAMAAREAANFRQEFGLTSPLPSAEDLATWSERLDAL
jgi:hypothetical protein